jgi:hypothetical protein
MPSLHDGIAALIVHAASLEVDAAQQFVVFPDFYLPMDKDNLAFNDTDAAFAFALQMNMLPTSAPQFKLTTKCVWDVYKDILNNKVLLAPTADGQSCARQFVEASAQLGIPQMTQNELEFYPTSILPVNLDDAAAWTPVVLGREAINQLAPQLREDHRAWLARFNLLPQLGDEFLEAISMERLTLVVLRPWYTPSVCTWRFWDLPDRIISDGNETPRGEMPGIITKVVLVRHLQVKLAASRLPDVGSSIMFRRIEASDTGSADRSLEPVAQLHRLSGAGPTVTRRTLLFNNFTQVKGTLADRIEALETELAREISSPDISDPTALTGSGGSQKFHVPFRFDTQQARECLSAPLATATATRAAQESELGTARNRLQELMQTKLQWQTNPPMMTVRDHRVTPTREYTQVNTRLIAEFEQNLAQQQTLISVKEQELARAQAEETRLRQALSILEQLSALGGDAQSYVLALVCDRTPKAPNPDPLLVTPS